MPLTDSSLVDLVGAFSVAAFLFKRRCSVLDADPSFDHVVGASLVIAGFCSCSMHPTDTSSLGMFSASFVAACFESCPLLGSMPPTDSTLDGLI